jgi:hypothetical protein
MTILFDPPRTALRFTLAIDIELSDIESGVQVNARTKDISLTGCRVDTNQLFSKGTKVRIKFSYRQACVIGLGRVIYSRPESGMGIKFTQIDPGHELILENWISKLAAPIQSES